MTILTQLVASFVDIQEYTTYVFKCLEDDVAVLSRYIMCIKYPNWNHSKIELGDVGYLVCEEIKAGIDKWYDGNKMIPYKYNAIQFLKFIKKPENLDKEYVM